MGSDMSCPHAVVERSSEEQWACAHCGEAFIPMQHAEVVMANVEEAAAGIMARYTRRMADMGVPGDVDVAMYHPNECPGHEGNPCKHCGASVFLGGN